MSLDKKMLAEAARVAIGAEDNRNFLLGAIGLRPDGILVSSRNIAAPNTAPHHHAETRLIRKLTPGSTIWVARVSKGDGCWALAKPCPGCENRLRSVGIKKIVYTIGPGEWGIIDPQG